MANLSRFLVFLTTGLFAAKARFKTSAVFLGFLCARPTALNVWRRPSLPMAHGGNGRQRNGRTRGRFATGAFHAMDGPIA
jgi:hypothetical protein